MNTAGKRPHKKTMAKRICAGAGGIAILLLLAVCFCAVCGDPLTKAYSRWHAVEYANEQWPGHAFTAAGIEGGEGFQYTVNVQSSVSVDTNFNVYVQCGIVRSTDYEIWGGTLASAERRFRREIEADLRAALDAAGYEWMGFDLMFTPDDAHSCPEGRKGVEVDMPYDKTNLPFAIADLYYRSEDPDAAFTQEDAEEWLRQAMRVARDAGIDLTYCQLHLYWGGGEGRLMRELLAGPQLLNGQLETAQ